MESVSTLNSLISELDAVMGKSKQPTLSHAEPILV
jgi:hypothetical protein